MPPAPNGEQLGLRIEQSATEVHLFWPDVPGVQLETSGDFGNGWTRVGSLTTVVDGERRASISSSSHSQFFRLAPDPGR